MRRGDADRLGGGEGGFGDEIASRKEVEQAEFGGQFEPGGPLGDARATFARGDEGIENGPPGDRLRGGEPTENEALSPRGDNGAVEPQFGELCRARFNGSGAAAEPARHFGGPQVQADREAVFERGGIAREGLDPAEQSLRRNEGAGGDQFHAPLDGGGADASEIEGAALAGLGGIGRVTVGLHLADANGDAGGDEFQGLARGHRARPDRAGADRAMPRDREDPVNGEAEEGPRVAGWVGEGGGDEGFDQLRQSLARGARDGDDRGRGQEGAGDQLGDFVQQQGDEFGIDEIDLGERDDPRGEPQQLHDVEMLAGLGHDAIVGGDDQQGEIEAGGPGDHVAHEAFVSGDIDEAELQRPGVEVGEAQVDGDAPGLLFREAIGGDAGEGLDQAGLAMVNVPGGPEDDGPRAGGARGRGAHDSGQCTERSRWRSPKAALGR